MGSSINGRNGQIVLHYNLIIANVYRVKRTSKTIYIQMKLDIANCIDTLTKEIISDY